MFGEDSRAKHLFDISQTNGKRVPELWKLTEDLSAELTAVINKKYGRDCKNIQETIAAMSVDNIRPHLSEMMYATGQYLPELEYTEDSSEQVMPRKPIGRWGRMWQEWVKAEYPTKVQIFVTEGRWQIIPRIIYREAESRFLELDKQYRQDNPRPQMFLEIQSWEKMRLLRNGVPCGKR